MDPEVKMMRYVYDDMKVVLLFSGKKSRMSHKELVILSTIHIVLQRRKQMIKQFGEHSRDPIILIFENDSLYSFLCHF